MPKKARVALNVRLPRALHRRLANAAGRNAASLNGEIAARLERSFQGDQLQKLVAIVEDVRKHLTVQEAMRLLDEGDAITEPRPGR